MPLVIQLSVLFQIRKRISLGFEKEIKSLRVVAVQERSAKESYGAKWPLLHLWKQSKPKEGMKPESIN